METNNYFEVFTTSNYFKQSNFDQKEKFRIASIKKIFSMNNAKLTKKRN